MAFLLRRLITTRTLSPVRDTSLDPNTCSMTNSTLPSNQFWLLAGDVPTGPFDVAQIHAELAGGRITWQTLACPVGSNNWLPLLKTPGLGPVAATPAAVTPAQLPATVGPKAFAPIKASEGHTQSAPASETRCAASSKADGHEGQTRTDSCPPNSAPKDDVADPSHQNRVPHQDVAGALPQRSSARPKAATETSASPPLAPPTAADGPAVSPPSYASDASKGNAELIGAAIGIGIVLLLLAGVGYGVYWAYEQIRPYTATEVCKKLGEAKTAAEAKKYATPRMSRFIDAAFADNSLDPNDTFEWTQEVDGPQPNTKLVGFRGDFFVPEAGQRVRIEGHFRVAKPDGWKADDMIVTGVEGASLPGPVSLVDEQRQTASPPDSQKPRTNNWPLKKSDSPSSTLKPLPQKPWYETFDPRNNKSALRLLVMAGVCAIGAIGKWLSSRSSSHARST